MIGTALAAYFQGEKSAGLFVAGVGVVAIVAAALLFRQMRAFSITMIVLALLELAIGVGLYLRTGPQVRRLEAQLASDEGGLRASESARMLRVQRNFRYIEYAEVAIIVVCALAALAMRHRAGVALALLIHAAIFLAFDITAEHRGAEYSAALRAPYGGL